MGEINLIKNDLYWIGILDGIYVCLLSRSAADKKVNFKRSTAGLNSKVSISLRGCQTKPLPHYLLKAIGITDGNMFFPAVLAWNEA